jgi:phage terminase large subunit
MTTQFKILPAYSSIFYSDKPYHLISGGRASGKSTQVAMYFILKLIGDDYFRGVISRYTVKSIQHSIYQDILDLIKKLNLHTLLDVKGDTIINIKNENMILCHSIKIADGNMLAKSKGLSNVSHLILDEATEVPSVEEYVKLIDSFRYREAERKIFLCFNPSFINHWIFKRFYLPDGSPNPKWLEDHNFLHTTYKDNIDNVDPRKVVEWERMKDLDQEYYEHHILGKWRKVGEGQILRGWNFSDWNPDPEALKIIGLDFGFHPDPTAIVRVYKSGRRLWVEELFYGTGKLNTDIVDILKNLGVGRSDLIYADSSEPKSIEEIRRGGFNIQAAKKGPDSVRWGIQELNSLEVYCNPASRHIIEEYNLYSYKTGSNVPGDEYNHTIDAIRYAISKERSRTSMFRKLEVEDEFM